MSISSYFIDIICAYILDLLVGDPYWLPHPVRFIGLLINACKRLLRYNGSKDNKYSKDNINDKNDKDIKEKISTSNDRTEFVKGILLALIVIGVTAGTVCFVLWLALLINPVLYRIVNIYIIFSALATKCLAVEANKMARILNKKDIVKSREKLAMLVGRDTGTLNEEQIIKAVVETTAENTVDGVISPLLFAIAGAFLGISAPLVYVFKAASTLDSMVGYKNEAYMFFGRASARIDDALNYIPARITGILIPISALLLEKVLSKEGISFRNSLSIMLRDRRNHKSPNCAYPEAAVAGALGIRLGGPGIYFGELVEKPYIGDSKKQVEVLDIHTTIKLMYLSSVIIMIPVIFYVFIRLYS